MSRHFNRWVHEFEENGQAEIRGGRVRLVFILILCVAFGVFGAFFIWLAFSENGAAGFFTLPFWIGLAAVAFFGVFGVARMLRQLINPQTLTVSTAGVSMRQGAKTELDVAWREVIGVHVGKMNHNNMVVLQLTPEAYERSMSSTAQRALSSLQQNLTMPGGYSLPNTLQGGAMAIAEFLAGAQTRVAEMAQEEWPGIGSDADPEPGA